MQNARLSELEKLLATSSSKHSPVKMSSAAKSTEELNSLKEENRVVSAVWRFIVSSFWRLRTMFMSLLLAYGSHGCLARASG
jgi:hypothetical protein